MRSSIILVAGYAASGKTRIGKDLARRLDSSCYLDKDTLSESLVDRLLVALGSPPGDRDSDIYRREVRPLEYKCLMAVGFEVAELGTSAVLCAPFLHQLTDRQWMGWLEQEVRSRGLRLKIVWVDCRHEMLLTRMVERGSPRDRAKIDDWPVYSAAVDENFRLRIQGKYLLFENSNSVRYDDELNRIVDCIRADSD